MAQGTPHGWTPDARKLWRSLVNDDFEWQEHELALIRQACASLSNATRAQAELDKAEDWLVAGVRGKQAHPLLAVVKEQRALFASLLKQIDIPDEVDEWDSADRPIGYRVPTMTRSESAKKAAQARWSKNG